MTEIIARLTADLSWRLSAAGKAYRPKPKERRSWGAFRIPRIAPLLLWCGYLAYAGLGMGWGGETSFLPHWLLILLFGWPGWIGSFFLITGLNGWINKAAELRAYRQLLRRNERFTLVEYSKYLQRQTARAKADPGLGGPTEVARLEATQRQLNQLLKGGTGLDAAVDSPLSAEADLAEAVLQSYEEAGADPLAELDARLPEELRTRIEALEQEAGRQRGVEQES